MRMIFDAEAENVGDENARTMFEFSNDGLNNANFVELHIQQSGKKEKTYYTLLIEDLQVVVDAFLTIRENSK